MSDVPPDVMSEIFTRLPVKSLLRFRSLSRPLCALIYSSSFIESHLQNSLNSNTDTTIVTINDEKPYSVDFDLFDKHNVLNFRATHVIGCCNGLVCLFSKQGVFLCNPSTRKLKKLPVYEIELYGKHFSFNIFSNWNFGFGYDFVNNDYKVVRISQFSFYRKESEFRVYSMKSNLWRRIGDFPNYIMFQRESGVLVNGKLHWVVTIYSGSKDVKTSNHDVEKAIIGSPDELQILSFDLATEEFRLVPHPRHSLKSCWMRIGKLGGKLCAHCSEWKSSYTNIWVMNCYGVEDSWTKLLSVTEHDGIHQYDYVEVVAYSKDEKQVLLKLGFARELLWYDLKQKTGKRVKIPGIPKFCYPYICHGSLVKLTGRAIRDVSQATQEKCKMGKRPRRDDSISKGFKLKI